MKKREVPLVIIIGCFPNYLPVGFKDSVAMNLQPSLRKVPDGSFNLPFCDPCHIKSFVCPMRRPIFAGSSLEVIRVKQGCTCSLNEFYSAIIEHLTRKQRPCDLRASSW